MATRKPYSIHPRMRKVGAPAMILTFPVSAFSKASRFRWPHKYRSDSGILEKLWKSSDLEKYGKEDEFRRKWGKVWSFFKAATSA